ncbi:MAG: M55 family metallopeptidase [Candidatus Bathyarchaeota archaeon]|nr:M55 family metallopeptidase [Candidatus Bathyarchaeota archaeon]
MKIYVVCDLEGVACVVDFTKQCMEKGGYYQQAIRMATKELNALVEGAIAGGATEIYAWPGHGEFPGGIDVELIHPECTLVMHACDEGPVGYDDSFDAMFLHGFHGMAGAENGVLAHSFTPLLRNVWLNDLKIGEIALNMLGFSEFKVLTVFVSGDQAAVDEASALMPGIEGAVVKWGLEEKSKLGALSVRKAVSLSPGKAQEVIRNAAERAMSKIGSLEPFWMDPPYVMRVEYTKKTYADNALKLPGVEKVNDTTTTQTRGKLSELAF